MALCGWRCWFSLVLINIWNWYFLLILILSLLWFFLLFFWNVFCKLGSRNGCLSGVETWKVEGLVNWNWLIKNYHRFGSGLIYFNVKKRRFNWILMSQFQVFIDLTELIIGLLFVFSWQLFLINFIFHLINCDCGNHSSLWFFLSVLLLDPWLMTTRRSLAVSWRSMTRMIRRSRFLQRDRLWLLLRGHCHRWFIVAFICKLTLEWFI